VVHKSEQASGFFFLSTFAIAFSLKSDGTLKPTAVLDDLIWKKIKVNFRNKSDII